MVGDIVDIQVANRLSCCTFSVQVLLSGFSGQDCLLRATLINVVDGSAIHGAQLIFTPKANTYQARADASVSASAAGTYTARFILYNPDGVELDRSETNPFSMVQYDHYTSHTRPRER
jgi:hypothetical protein